LLEAAILPKVLPIYLFFIYSLGSGPCSITQMLFERTPGYKMLRHNTSQSGCSVIHTDNIEDEQSLKQCTMQKIYSIRSFSYRTET